MKASGFLPALALAGCASAPTGPKELWTLAQESPLTRVCVAPCSATFRLGQITGHASCPSVEWLVTDFEGRQVYRTVRDSDCEPGEPTPRFRFTGTFPAGTWVVNAYVTVEGRVVARPWREIEVR